MSNNKIKRTNLLQEIKRLAVHVDADAEQILTEILETFQAHRKLYKDPTIFTPLMFTEFKLPSTYRVSGSIELPFPGARQCGPVLDRRLGCTCYNTF